MIMKFSTFILSMLMLSFISYAQYAYGQGILDKKITINIRNKDFKKALREISKKAKISFSYTGNIIPDNATLNVKVKDIPLREVLTMVLSKYSLTYVVYNNKIIIRHESVMIEKKEMSPEQGVDTAIQGIVTDANNHPLVGVTISVAGTHRGTITDATGHYRLHANNDDTLIFSYIGFKTEEIPVNDKAEINVRLTNQVFVGQEVVVVGYGTQKMEDITGAISSITAKELKDQPVASLQQSLEGKSPGVQITQNSGSPGKNAEVRIRGLTSINNSDPLYVVDGIPLTANGINAIDPSDIASVEVLKDASAQAIYGSRGANGVILIETKKGSAGNSHMSINVYGGIQQVRKKLDMLNSQEFVELNTEAYKNAGLPSPWGPPSQYTHTTNWQDALFRTAPIHNYDIAFSGGTQKLTYRLSGTYFNQQGIIIGSSYKRLSLRLNSTFNPINKIEVGENIAVNKSIQYLVEEGAVSRINILEALKMDPTVPVKDSAGNYLGPRYSDALNPIASIHYTDMNHPYNDWSLIGGTYLLYKPVKGLTLKSEISMDLDFGDNKSFNPSYDVAPNQNNPIPNLSDTKSLGYNWTWDNTATYETNIDQDNHLKILVGISQEQYTYDFVTGANQGQPGNAAYLQYLDAGTSNPTVGGSQAQWRLLSYIGRINYNYKEKYFLTANIRRDGSSKFGENNKYGNFPSASIGWVPTQESFWLVPQWLDYLKLRGSWGIVGNQTSAGYYDFSSTINNYYYAFGSPATASLTAEPGGLGNPDLQWEQVRQWDVGFDYRLLNNGLTGTFDYYNKKTNNMLLSIPILFESGYANGPLTNVASMLNSGIELTADYFKQMSNKLNVDIGFNIATLHNVVLSLQNEGAQIFSSPNMTEAGHSVAAFYGYVFDGIFQNEAQVKDHATQPGAAPGDIRFKDLNGDGVINDQDQTFLGSPLPKFSYGFHIGSEYNNFDLNLSFAGIYGNKIYQSYKYNTDGFFISNYNMEKEALSRWHGEGTSNHIPRLNANDPNDNARASSFYLADGSYLRLRNITLGYNFPKSLLDKWKIAGLRIYLSAQDLLTFTKYDGYDPEIGIEFGGNAGTLNLGEDQGNYPQPITITAGINLTL
jgi:TonB-linked SusC/RagA family outer membrane protein